MASRYGVPPRMNIYRTKSGRSVGGGRRSRPICAPFLLSRKDQLNAGRREGGCGMRKKMKSPPVVKGGRERKGRHTHTQPREKGGRGRIPFSRSLHKEVQKSRRLFSDQTVASTSFTLSYFATGRESEFFPFREEGTLCRVFCLLVLVTGKSVGEGT